MAEVGSIYVRIGARIDDFEAAMRKVGGSIKQAESRFEGLKKVGQELTAVGAKVAAAGAGIGAGLGLAVKTAADFEAAMSRVKALSGASEADFARLTETAKQLGATTAFSASQAAEGMQFLAMAGYKTNEIIAAMPGLLAAAAAGQTDLGRTADIVSNILSGFGLAASETGRVADVLTKAFTSSNTSLEMLGETMKYVAPVAKGVGLSLEEVTAAAGLLGNAGIQASQAGTALRAIFLRLADPPKEAAEALKQLGVQVTDSSGKMRPLSEILADMKKGMEGMTEAQKAAIASTIAGTEASAALLALLDAGPETLANFTKELQNAGGTAERIAKEQLNNLHGQLIILKSGLEGMAIAIGEALLPYLKRFAEAVQWLVDRFNSLPEPVKQGIALFAAFAAGLAIVGGAILMFTGLMMQGVAGIATLAAKLGALPAVFTGLAGPVGIAIAAVTAFAAIAYVIIKNWEPIKEFFINLWEGIKTTIINAANAVLDFLRQWGPLILAAVTGPIGLLVYAIVKYWDDIKNFTSLAWETIKNAVVAAFEWMYNHNYYFQYLVDFIRQAWQTIRKFSISIWNAIKDALAAVWETIRTIVTTCWQAIQDVTVTVWTAISQRLLALWQQIMAQASAAWNNIYAVISGIWNRIKQGFENLVSTAWNWGKNLLSNFISGITSMLSRLWDTLSDVASTVAGFLGFHSPTKLGPGREADKWAPNFIDMFAQGLRAGIPKLEATLQDLALTLNPAVAAAGNVSNVTYGGHTIIINVSGGSTSEIAEELLRELARRGVRF